MTLKTTNKLVLIVALLVLALTLCTLATAQTGSLIGKEVSVPQHLQDGQELWKPPSTSARRSG